MGLFGGGGDSIDVNEAHRRATAGEVILVDVRETHEWAGGHAPMAKHIPLSTVGTSLADEGIGEEVAITNDDTEDRLRGLHTKKGRGTNQGSW